MAKDKILLFCAVPPQFPELFLVAKHLKKEGRYEPFFVFDNFQDRNHEAIEACIKEGIACISYKAPKMLLNDHYIYVKNAVSKGRLTKDETNKTIGKFLKKNFPLIINSVLRFLRFLYYVYTSFRMVAQNFSLGKKVLELYKPVLTVFPIDTVGYFFDPLIPLTAQSGIPSCVIPFCFVKTASTADWFYSLPPESKYIYSTKTSYNYLISKLFPAWVINYKGENLLRANLGWILATWWYGISKKNPWLDNSGSINKLLVENKRLARMYKEDGIKDESISVVGCMQYDTMHVYLQNKEQLLREIIKETGISYNEGDFVVVLSLPEEFDFSNRNCEFTSHEDIVKALSQPFHLYDNVTVIYSLHPRLSFDKVQYVERDKARITRRPLAEVLPCADAFITITSAAIRLAISCGIPVVDYDIFRYSDEYYESAKGVVTVDTQEDYRTVIERIVLDSNFYQCLKEKQEEASYEWGKPDGLAAQRFTAIFDELIKGSRGRG
ncbi:MAG: hypothetical protein ACOY3J_10065 [Bacillota bacterium]|uniref:Uncharacterized protein n=1 Tax=Thermanaerosceptrum fracticalcis TaxID=1712410 RepID=A0A7G6E4K0_THEFR|nr:hypothetical protein [Thermanaerosceptrum fracticalcis]QNB47004.1 hypothetical protein BR63_12210 [Thermanaerosceptrum fracticalcis]